jgi:hypothetical protein
MTDKSIPTYIQQHATLHSLFNLEIALHVSGGTSTHHQVRMRIEMYLQHLVLVTQLLLSAAIVEELELKSSTSSTIAAGPTTTNSTAITTLRR